MLMTQESYTPIPLRCHHSLDAHVAGLGRRRARGHRPAVTDALPIFTTLKNTTGLKKDYNTPKGIFITLDENSVYIKSNC